MLVRRVSLTNVRARSHLDVRLDPALNILVGPNGVGKTTVLEAVALVLTGSNLRTGSVKDLIKRDADYLRVEVTLATGDAPEMTAAAAYDRDGDRRLTADGRELNDAARWLETLPVRTFVPDDLRLIKGSPRRRREYLDTLAARTDPSYRADLRQYEEALTQRNSLLRSRWCDDERLFSPWEQILAQTGVAVAESRAARLQAFVGTFQGMYADVTGGPADAIRLVYRSNVAGLDVDTYAARLAEMRQADRQRTFTHLGPHRDDLRLLRRGLDMRECASQGEQRAALLTLVLAEWEQAGAGAERPLLLLDDVMSELDETRRRALVAVVMRGGQTVITTTDLRYFSPEEIAQANVVELVPEAASREGAQA